MKHTKDRNIQSRNIVHYQELAPRIIAKNNINQTFQENQNPKTQ